MSLGFWAHLLTCGCVGTRGGSPATTPTRSNTPTFLEWDFYAAATPPSHRSWPSDASASTADSRTALACATIVPSSQWSPEPSPPLSLPQRVHRSTSKVVMYLRHSASTVLRGPSS